MGVFDMPGVTWIRPLLGQKLQMQPTSILTFVALLVVPTGCNTAEWVLRRTSKKTIPPTGGECPKLWLIYSFTNKFDTNWYGNKWHCFLPSQLARHFVYIHQQKKTLKTPNNGTPKSSMLIGFSIINHPFWGVSLLLETPTLREASRSQSHPTPSQLGEVWLKFIILAVSQNGFRFCLF